MTEKENRLVIMANKNMSRGKYAAHAVHVALDFYGHTDHGAVIVLSGSAGQIKEQAIPETVFQDQGRTEVEPGTVTAGIISFEETDTPKEYQNLDGEATYELKVEKLMQRHGFLHAELAELDEQLLQIPIGDRIDAFDRIADRAEAVELNVKRKPDYDPTQLSDFDGGY